MSSSISLWDSRFSDDSGRAVALYSKRQGDQAVDVGDILAATKSQLPYIGPEQLQFHGILGAGTSFKVTREIYTKPVIDPLSQVRPSPYFVAVKHMILSPRTNGNQDDHKRRTLYSSVSREIRVLMHPSLRDHCCIIPVLAYGWTNHPVEGANPYLIVDYSDHGTLTQYLRRCKIPLHERRELAVDVAVGIKVLHDNQIIHGDIKPDNILVFDSANDYSSRPQTAKLADFGSSLFEQDVQAGASYLGTSLYNSPEIEGRPRYNGNSNCKPQAWCVTENTPKMSQYKKADVYSFGLLLWETAKNGADIIERYCLADGQSELDFLEKVCKTEKDGMLQRARVFCEKLKSDGVKENLLDPIRQTFALVLRDDSLERANIADIIESLTRGSDETRGPTRYPLARINPPTADYGRIPSNAEHLQRPMPIPRQVRKARYMPIQYKPLPRPKGGKVHELAPYVKPDSHHTNPGFVYKTLDMFHVAVATSPPWGVQADIVDKLKLDTTYERDPLKRAEASLQFSVCYRLGFGIEQDLVKSIQCLSQAFSHNPIAQSVFSRVRKATEVTASNPLTDIPSHTAFDRTLDNLRTEEYFLRRFQSSQQVAGVKFTPTSPSFTGSRLLSAAALDDITALQKLLSSEDFDDALLSEAILGSCKYGWYRPLQLLLPRCHVYRSSAADHTPLHWLIMFNGPEPSQLAQSLVIGRPGEASKGKGLCSEMLGSMPNSVVSFPEHCMELFGSPLHWAVRIRHVALVQILIDLGADVNLRWKAPRQLSTEPTTLQIPDYSPLDLAATFHLPEIVDALLAAGAHMDYTGNGYQYSALHVIGQPVFPFAHDILHGRHRQEAVRQVIQSLKMAGSDINSRDSDGRTPLAKALENPDLEDYILTELLEAGANVDASITLQNENAAVVIARNSVCRRLTTSRLRLVLPFISNINEKDNGISRRNALHHCATAMSGKMVEILLKDPRISVDESTSDGQTALHIAATYGSSDIALLLVEAGASLNAKDEDGRTPLEIAALNRWVDVVYVLIRLGAQLTFTGVDGEPQSSILHAASANAKDGNAIITEILEYHEEMRENRSLVNTQDHRGWTVLHQAAYFGDRGSVIALIKNGADPSILTSNDSNDTGAHTALDIAKEVLAAVSTGTLGPDHERILDGGPPAVTSFSARLAEIIDTLERGL